MAVNDYTIRFFKVAKRKTERMMGNARLVHGREKEKQRVRYTSHEEKSWEKVIFWAENSELFLYFFEILCFYWDVGYRVMQGGSIFLLFNPLVVFSLCRYLTKKQSLRPRALRRVSSVTVMKLFTAGSSERVKKSGSVTLMLHCC